MLAQIDSSRSKDLAPRSLMRAARSAWTLTSTCCANGCESPTPAGFGAHAPFAECSFRCVLPTRRSVRSGVIAACDRRWLSFAPAAARCALPVAPDRVLDVSQARGRMAASSARADAPDCAARCIRAAATHVEIASLKTKHGPTSPIGLARAWAGQVMWPELDVAGKARVLAVKSGLFSLAE